MKQIVFTLTALLMLGFSGTAQKTTYPVMAGQYELVRHFPASPELRGATQIDNKLDSIKSESHVLSFEYDFAGRLIWEKWNDLYDTEYSWKSEFVKNAAGITERIESYSYINSHWVMTCYEEFLIDSLGRRTQRLNVNYFDSAWVVGGKGFYYYYPDGKLQEYKQLIHMGNNVFDDLSRDLYAYDSLGNPETVTYMYYMGGTWQTDVIDTYTFSGNQIVNISSVYNNNGTFEYNHKYDYDYSAAGNASERRYHIGNGASSWSGVRDKYVWRYDEMQSSNNVAFPFESGTYSQDYKWFNMNHLRTEEDWYTTDQNTNLLAYVETAYYFYSPLTGIDDESAAGEMLISVYPNPAVDQISLRTKNAAIIENVTISDYTGKLVVNTNNTETIDISVLTSGIYFITAVTSDHEMLTGKFVKE
jgi:hypothetical protein